MNRPDRQRWPAPLLRAGALAGALCLVAVSHVFVTFDAHRIKLVEAPIAALEGQIHVEAAESELTRLTAPFAVIARIRHDSASRQRFAVTVDGRVVCEPSVRPGGSRRIDCALSGPWQASSRHQVTVTGPAPSWSLDYLELATHHGATRGHDLVVVPANSTRYAPLPGAWIAVMWLALIGLFLMERPRMARPIQVTYNIVAVFVAVFLGLVLISRVISPYAVLLSRTGFLRAACLLLAPRLWAAGRWLMPRPTDSAVTPRAGDRWVILVSGALGFVMGALAFPEWQVAVETAQVVAGLVTYPAGNPFYVYHTKLWTALHQVCAVLLLAGVSEHTLSLILSGLLGMVSFQAVSVLVYALSRDHLLAVGSAFVVFFTGIAEFGVIYPISLLGTTHTYGALGLSLIVLVAALLGLGCRRTAAFLLGLTPAVHPSLGFWFVIIVALAALGERQLRERYGQLIPYFLAGCGLTALSLVVQVGLLQDAPPIDREIAGMYLTAFIRFWDGHRAQVDFSSLGVFMNVAALVLAAVWLHQFKTDLPQPAGLLLRIVAVSGTVSIALASVSTVRPEQVPTDLLVLMPGRFLNFNAFVFPALLIGLIGRCQRTKWGGWLTLMVIAALLLTERSRLWLLIHRSESVLRHVIPEGPLDTLGVLALASLGLFICARLRSRADGEGRGARIARIAALGLTVWIAVQTWELAARPFAALQPRTNDRVLSAAAEGSGLLLTGGALHLVQLRTRRAVLLDGGGLDGLPYSLEAAPELGRILRDVYGIDFFNPPGEARGAGVIPDGANRIAWESYSPAKWWQIRRTYGVTQVLTYADWKLALPEVVRDEVHVLYGIPP